MSPVNDADLDVDVAVVGASIAGCTAARLFAQAGLNGPDVRRRLDAQTREAYIVLVQSADIARVDRHEMHVKAERSGQCRAADRGLGVLRDRVVV